jgi:hypothetical protein
MKWKQALHAEHGTALLETTWVQIMSPSGLDELAEALRSHGLELDWHPDRPPRARQQAAEARGPRTPHAQLHVARQVQAGRADVQRQ